MNENHHHDPDISARVERLLSSGTPSGSPAADQLAQTRPQAKPDFQQSLEDRLLAQLSITLHEGEPDMTALPQRMGKPANRNRLVYAPLTLAAALVVLVLVGSILLAGNSKPPTSNLAVIQAATKTPTPSASPTATVEPSPDTQFLQVQLRDLESQIEAAQAAFEDSQNADQQTLLTNLQELQKRYQDLSARLGTPVPAEMVNIAVALQNLPRGFQFPNSLEEVGNVVNYMSWPVSALPVNALLEDSNGLETLLGKTLKTDVFREQPMLTTLLTNDLSQIANVASDNQLNIPNDKVAVSVPVNPAQIIAAGLETGDQVDMVASLLFVDVDETFQSVLPPNVEMLLTNPETGAPCRSGEPCLADPMVVTTINAESNDTCPVDKLCQVKQAVINDAMLVHIGDFIGGDDPLPDIVTLAVSPAEATVIVWLLESKVPYILRPASDADELPVYGTPIPHEMWLSEIDYNWIVSDLSQIHEGDLVDVTFSFMLQAPEPAQSNTLQPENGWVFNRVILSGVKVYKLGTSIGHPDEVVTLLLQPEDGVLLSLLLDTLTPIAVTVNQAGSAAPEFRIDSLADDRVTVTLPIEAVTNGDQTWQEGTNTVDVIADTTFSITRTDPSTSELNQQQVSQILIEDAEFVTNAGGGAPGDDGVMTATITIAQDDLAKLGWAVNSGIPLTLQLSND